MLWNRCFPNQTGRQTAYDMQHWERQRRARVSVAHTAPVEYCLSGHFAVTGAEAGVIALTRIPAGSV